MTQGVEVVPGLFRFLCGPPATLESVAAECDRSGAICFCIDNEMVRLLHTPCGVRTCMHGRTCLCSYRTPLSSCSRVTRSTSPSSATSGR